MSSRPVRIRSMQSDMTMLWSVCLCSVFKMSALNSNNTFDGLDEPVRPTPAGGKRRLDKENLKKQQKKKVLRWRVNTHCGIQCNRCRGCSLWRSLLECPPPAPETRVRDPLGVMVRTWGSYINTRLVRPVYSMSPWCHMLHVLFFFFFFFKT